MAERLLHATSLKCVIGIKKNFSGTNLSAIAAQVYNALLFNRIR